MEHYVKIKRFYGFREEANNDPAVQEYYDSAFKASGAYFERGKIYGSGLTKEEEKN